MTKIAIINDTHAGVRNSNEIFLNNAGDFYSKVFFPYLKEHNIDTVVHLGDYWDNRRAINVKSIKRNREMFLDPLEANGIHMHIIRGNHDTFYKDTGAVNSLDELLGNHPNITIYDKPTKMDFGVKNYSFGLVPWIDDENRKECMEFIETTDCDIVGGHFEIFGLEMLKGTFSTHGLPTSTFNRFDKVLSGHFHTKSTNGNIWYLGSQMEFTWSDAHDDKYFHVLDLDTGDVTPILNPYTLYYRINYNDTTTDYSNFDLSHVDGKFVKIVVEVKSNNAALEYFVTRLQESNVLDLKVAENFDEFSGGGVNDGEVSFDNTQTLLESYIDAVDTPLDKERLKKVMNDLMIEAQKLEFS